ncbi:MAG: hypothetical protein JJV89_00675 [Desulfosarcina sp.]|nr:hypothetical protein [Desulfobacterales bacterium]
MDWTPEANAAIKKVPPYKGSTIRQEKYTDTVNFNRNSFIPLSSFRPRHK